MIKEKLYNLRIFSVLIFAFLISCNNSANSSKTEIFYSYLNKEFDLNPAKEKSYYLIIPSTACTGCDQSAFYAFSQSKLKNLYLIISKKSYAKWNNKAILNNVLIDESGMLDKINIGAENTTLIVWEDNTIKESIHLTPFNTDSIIKGLDSSSTEQPYIN